MELIARFLFLGNLKWSENQIKTIFLDDDDDDDDDDNDELLLWFG